MTFDSTTTGDPSRISSTSSDSRGVEDSASERLDEIKSSPSSPLSPADCTNYSSSFSSTTSSSSSGSDQHQTDQPGANNNNNDPDKPSSLSIPNSLISTSNNTATASTTTTTSANHHSTNNSCDNGGNENCYNQVLDDEIRSRLDRLNALSDLINSLEQQFDEANSLFRNTLKCSSDRLSSIAKTLGTKSIRQGRVYNAAKISVEQSQSDCQKACVQFEQANKDHQIAKNAIREAELKLREKVGQTKSNGVIAIPNFSSIESIDISNLKLVDSQVVSSKNHLQHHHHLQQEQKSVCDTNIELSDGSNELKKTTTSGKSTLAINNILPKPTSNNNTAQETDAHDYDDDDDDEERTSSSPNQIVKSAARLSEELNQAIMRLIESEKKRSQSERLHLDRANKLMVAQENLIRLEREHGQSIRRSQVYFNEAKQFDAKLNSVKGEICRISEEILAAKQAYARTLSELEKFSDDLHDSSSSVFK